jgi:hypothetical protein
MKLTLELTEDPEGGFTTRREWSGTKDAPPLFIKIAQRLELAVLQVLDMFSHSIGVGEGKTEEEARIKLGIDRDIKKSGEYGKQE